MEIYVHKINFIRLFSAVLNIIVQNRKPCKYPSSIEWISRWWFIHAMKRYPVTACIKLLSTCQYRRKSEATKRKKPDTPPERLFADLVLVAKSCPTLCNPVDCSLPGSSVHGIFQARIPEWVAISSSRGY